MDSGSYLPYFKSKLGTLLV